MKKLHLSVISLCLCLILGVGSLAAQKGKKKEPKTTFNVSVIAGTITLSPGVPWLLASGDCKGEAEGSNLEARFPLLDKCAPVVVVGNLRLKLLQISLSITRKSTRLNIFFRDEFGDHYQSDDISLPPEAVVDLASYTDFDVQVNQEVSIRAEHKGKPGTGTEAAVIGVGTVEYRAQTP